jgi:hypothetical protein
VSTGISRSGRLPELKQKTCKVCGGRYLPWSVASNLNRFCGFECATDFAKAKRDRDRAKASRRRLKERREALKTRGDYLKEAQQAFNAFIRARDERKPCVSCGSTTEASGLKGGRRDAGHYRSTGSAPHMRFHLLNCHAQCKRCNRDLSGNPVEYRKALVERYGEDRVAELEHDNRSPQYRIEDLKRIKSIFRKRARLYLHRLR